MPGIPQERRQLAPVARPEYAVPRERRVDVEEIGDQANSLLSARRTTRRDLPERPPFHWLTSDRNDCANHGRQGPIHPAKGERLAPASSTRPQIRNAQLPAQVAQRDVHRPCAPDQSNRSRLSLSYDC